MTTAYKEIDDIDVFFKDFDSKQFIDVYYPDYEYNKWDRHEYMLKNVHTALQYDIEIILIILHDDNTILVWKENNSYFYIDLDDRSYNFFFELVNPFLECGLGMTGYVEAMEL